MTNVTPQSFQAEWDAGSAAKNEGRAREGEMQWANVRAAEADREGRAEDAKAFREQAKTADPKATALLEQADILRASAREMAKEYIAANPNVRARYDGLSIPALVGLIDTYRAQGLTEDVIIADMYQLAVHPPQNIGGNGDIVRSAR